MPRMSKPLPGVATLGDAMAAWLRSLRAGDKSPRTVSAYAYALGKLSERVDSATPVERIEQGDIEALYVALKASGLSPASRSAIDRPLRTFFRWAVGRGYVTKESTRRACQAEG